MPTIGELLKAKKSAPVPYQDVEVLWDTDVSDRIAALEAEIESRESDQRLTNDNGVDDLRAQIQDLRDNADSVLTFRFRKLDGYTYAGLCAKYPPRLDVSADLGAGGYNIDEVCKAAAKANGVRIDGDVEEKPSEAEWDDLFVQLSGHDVKRIRDAIWMLNEYGPAQQLELAKKAHGSTRS